MVLNLLNHATKIGWEAPEMRTGYERIQSVKPEAELSCLQGTEENPPFQR